jgi:glutamate dehydrogenase
VPPADVVRHDGDDAYLVVAADKGTATFSDHANAISADYGFWLDDAFASGGSVGYDHKAMGITARGAWESVRRHFREMGIDTQTEDFTAVGIGDMSGDVFGNGMLLSEHLRLVAAFDHRHVFLDPAPDAATGFRERRRLFSIGRSSWADYDTSLISEGGGVFSRSAKSIPISAQVRSALGLEEGVSALTPPALIRAILAAPVDLLWNGGIGTYVKASAQTNAEVGDKANDAIRVNGRDLRARVVGEGGNLGFTQRGRVEAALAGVRINTDAIDNSAGVDTSDHEVNIKVLLDLAIREGRLDRAERDELLVAMTDDVARLVLRDNYEQNIVIANALAQAASLFPVHRRMMRDWEERGLLDREVEDLPDEEECTARAEVGRGLESPELAVLLAYAKIILADELLASGMADDEAFIPVLESYFPPLMLERCGDLIARHPLRREIITTSVVNRIVNHGGISFAFRAAEETAATSVDVARAFACARAAFDLPTMQQRIEALDGVVPAGAQCALRLEMRRVLDRATRWFLVGGGAVDVAATFRDIVPVVQTLSPDLPLLLKGAELEGWQQRAEQVTAIGAPADIAADATLLLHCFSLLDVARITLLTGHEPRATAEVYYSVSAHFDVDDLLTRISGLPRGDRWQALARGAMRYELYEALREIVIDVMRSTGPGQQAERRLEAWAAANGELLARTERTLAEIREHGDSDLATISVALRSLRSLVP